MIELLVVLVIILVLIALSLPAAKGLRAEADKAHCVANLSALAKATLAAANQDGGYLPGNTCAGGANGLGGGEGWTMAVAGRDINSFFGYDEGGHSDDFSYVYSIKAASSEGGRAQFPGTNVAIRSAMPFGWWAIRPFVENVESMVCPAMLRNGSLFSTRRRYGGDLLFGSSSLGTMYMNGVGGAAELTAAQIIEPNFMHLAKDNSTSAQGRTYILKGTNVFGYNLATAWNGGLFWDTLIRRRQVFDFGLRDKDNNPVNTPSRAASPVQYSGGGGQPWGLAQAWTSTAWTGNATPSAGAMVTRTADPRAARYRELMLQRLPETTRVPARKGTATAGFKVADAGRDRSTPTRRDIEYHTWQTGKVVPYKTNAAVVYWMSPIRGSNRAWREYTWPGVEFAATNDPDTDYYGSYIKTSQIDSGECVMLNDYFRYEAARGLNDSFIFPEADKAFSAGGTTLMYRPSAADDKSPTHRKTNQLMPFLFAHDHGGNVAFADGSVRWLGAPQRLDPGRWGVRKPDTVQWDQSAISGYLDTSEAKFDELSMFNIELGKPGLIPPRPWTPMPCNY